MPHTRLSLQEVADYLHLSVDDIKTLVRRREIPCQENGGRCSFSRGEIDAWASQRLLGFNGKNIAEYHKKSSAKMHDISKSSAIIAELLKPSFIDPAISSRTKSSIVRDMVALADSTGLLYDRSELLDSIELREKLCSTALSGGLAILHSQHHDAFVSEDSFIVISRAVQPIPFGAPDGKESDIFFLVCCQDDRIHLHVLARICMLCYHTPLLMGLRDCETAADMYELIAQQEEAMVKEMR